MPVLSRTSKSQLTREGRTENLLRTTHIHAADSTRPKNLKVRRRECKGIAYCCWSSLLYCETEVLSVGDRHYCWIFKFFFWVFFVCFIPFFSGRLPKFESSLILTNTGFVWVRILQFFGDFLPLIHTYDVDGGEKQRKTAIKNALLGRRVR